MKRLVLTVTGLCLVRAAAVPVAGAQDANLERLVRAYWEAPPDEHSVAVDRIVRSGAEFAAVYQHLREGRTAHFLVAAVEGMVGLLKSNPKLSLAVGQLKTLFLS